MNYRLLGEAQDELELLYSQEKRLDSTTCDSQNDDLNIEKIKSDRKFSLEFLIFMAWYLVN